MCVCILELVTRHANRIFSAPYYIVFCRPSGSTIISTLSHKGHDFRKKNCWAQNVFWFSIQFLSETFLILTRIQRDITNLQRSSRKVPVILLRFYSKLYFLDRFSKNPQISSFIKIHLVGAGLFHAGWRTDITKLIVTFRNLAKVPKNIITENKCASDEFYN